MSFVLDALRKSSPQSIAPAHGGMLEPVGAWRYRVSGPTPWLIALAVLAAVAAGAAARTWSRHVGMSSVVAPPSPPVATHADVAPLTLSLSKDMNASRPASSPGSGPAASGSRAPSAGRAEMPDILRKQLSQLAISGYILDKQAGSLAIIDGKVRRVGDEAAPGLRIEKIDADGVTFNHQGYRFQRR